MTMLIVGHRGAMTHEPENSLTSYALAEAVGVDEIELDVRLSKDDVLFLLHDDTLDRTAGDDSARNLGPAAELTIEQLQSVVLDSGRGVVTLDEMYEATSTFIQLEIKDPATVPHLARYFEDHPSYARRTILTGFNPDALRRSSELMPSIGRCIIVSKLETAEAFEGGLRGLLEYTRSTRFACGFEGLTREVVDAVHEMGLEFHVWPTRTIEDVRRAIELGADGTTSDDPEQARAWYDQVRSELNASS